MERDKLESSSGYVEAPTIDRLIDCINSSSDISAVDLSYARLSPCPTDSRMGRLYKVLLEREIEANLNGLPLLEAIVESTRLIRSGELKLPKGLEELFFSGDFNACDFSKGEGEFKGWKTFSDEAFGSPTDGNGVKGKLRISAEKVNTGTSADYMKAMSEFDKALQEVWNVRILRREGNPSEETKLFFCNTWQEGATIIPARMEAEWQRGNGLQKLLSNKIPYAFSRSCEVRFPECEEGCEGVPDYTNAIGFFVIGVIGFFVSCSGIHVYRRAYSSSTRIQEVSNDGQEVFNDGQEVVPL